MPVSLNLSKKLKGHSVLKSEVPGEGESFAYPFEGLKRWQRLQDLCAESIQANLFLLDSRGEPLSRPSLVTPTYNQLIQYSHAPSTDQTDFVVQAFFQWRAGNETDFSTCHGLHYVISELKRPGEMFAYLILGPVLAGQRESSERYRTLCEELKIREDVFLDRIREVTVFSHTRIRVIRDFLAELGCYLIEMPVIRTPQVFPEETAESFSLRQRCELVAGSALEMGMEITGASSGSVMLLKGDRRSFWLPALRDDAFHPDSDYVSPVEGTLAGYALKSRHAVVLRESEPGEALRKMMVKSRVGTSVLLPMLSGEREVGVMCLNSSSEGDLNLSEFRFVEQLGILAAHALEVRQNL